MIVKSLVKLLDEAMLPAVALIIAKMLGFLAASLLLDLPFTVQNADLLGILPTIQFESLADYIKAENYSNLAMLLVAATGSIFVLVRAHFFHESHIHPNVHAKLVSAGLQNLVAPSYHLYHQAAIWLIFLWLTTGFLLISTIILNITHPLISAIALIVSANFSWVLIMDIEKEIEISQNSQ